MQAVGISIFEFTKMSANVALQSDEEPDPKRFSEDTEKE
jgi:hypothetical protein